MRYGADEFVVGGLIGFIQGECEIDAFSGEVVPMSFEWDDACFCLESDPTGEPAELTCCQKQAIETELRASLTEIDPAGCMGFVFVTSRKLIAA